MEAEAITRLTEGLQPPAIRAILVQCLTGEVAPSVTISRLLAMEGASTVRAAIDDVTHRRHDADNCVGIDHVRRVLPNKRRM